LWLELFHYYSDKCIKFRFQGGEPYNSVVVDEVIPLYA